MRKQIGATSPTPVSPTSISPAYYILVPFRLLMQSVTSLDYPWQVAVTLAYMEGGDSGYIPGLSVDGHSYSGIRRYSDMGVDIPGLSVDGQSYSGIQGYSDMEWEG